MTKKSIFALILAALAVFGAVLLVTMVLISSPQTRPQQSSRQALPTPPLNAEAVNSLANYPTMAGGWILENNCKTLSLEARREFRWNAAEATIGIARLIGRLPLEMQEAAKKVAGTMACDEDARSVIKQTAILSQAVAAGVGGKPWSVKAYESKQMSSLANVLAAQYVDNKCKRMPKSMRDELEIYIHRIEATYQISKPKAFEAMRQQVVGTLESRGFVCSPQADMITMLGATLAREMVEEYD